jgi:hypothetical protein
MNPRPDRNDHPVPAIASQIAGFRFNFSQIVTFAASSQVNAHTLTFYLSNATFRSSNL